MGILIFILGFIFGMDLIISGEFIFGVLVLLVSGNIAKRFRGKNNKGGN